MAITRGKPRAQNPAYRPADIFLLPKIHTLECNTACARVVHELCHISIQLFSRGWASEIILFGQFMQLHFSEPIKLTGKVAVAIFLLGLVANVLGVLTGAVDLYSYLYSYLTISSSKEAPVAREAPIKSDRLTEKENNTTSLTLDRAAKPEPAATIQFSEPDIKPQGPLKQAYPQPPAPDPFATVSEDTPVPGQIAPIVPYRTTAE